MKSLPPAVLLLVLAASPARAQPVEVAPLVIYTSSGSLDRTAENVDGLKIDDGLTWGARGTFFLTEHFGVEGLWTYQSTGLMMTSGANTAEVFEMTINQAYGNAVYQAGSAGSRLRPFVFGGAGATFFEAPDLEGEVKLTWNVGAGVKWFPQQRFGIEGRFRYRPTQLDDDDAGTCGPFDFCQGTMKQIDVALGAIFRF
jgi:hypothetical protein